MHLYIHDIMMPSSFDWGSPFNRSQNEQTKSFLISIPDPPAGSSSSSRRLAAPAFSHPLIAARLHMEQDDSATYGIAIGL